MKKLSRCKLLNNKSMEIDSYVLPNTRPWPHSKSNPWWQHYCFLFFYPYQSKKITTFYQKIKTLTTKKTKTLTTIKIKNSHYNKDQNFQ